MDVMLRLSAKLRINSAKHLAFSSGYEDEILRLRLRMTLRHSPSRERRFGFSVLRMKTFRATILAIVILALATSGADAEKIRTAIPQANLNYLSIHVADAKGFFREEGLDNETVVISGPLSIAARSRSGGAGTTDGAGH
jgi:hypothetical protein